VTLVNRTEGKKRKSPGKGDGVEKGGRKGEKSIDQKGPGGKRRPWALPLLFTHGGGEKKGGGRIRRLERVGKEKKVGRDLARLWSGQERGAFPLVLRWRERKEGKGGCKKGKRKERVPSSGHHVGEGQARTFQGEVNSKK